MGGQFEEDETSAKLKSLEKSKKRELELIDESLAAEMAMYQEQLAQNECLNLLGVNCYQPAILLLSLAKSSAQAFE